LGSDHFDTEPRCQAIAKDPSYALAYSGLADAYAVLPVFGGTPSEDYPGRNEMWYDWDFVGGEAEHKKASMSNEGNELEKTTKSNQTFITIIYGFFTVP
jgi:hypothetical protein